MATRPHLKRALGLYATMAIVIGSVVGSGIFTKPSRMATDLPSAGLILLVWVFTGGLTLFGALTQCELTGQMPRTGGLYEYFREIYGEKIGFLYGWANFTIAGSGAIAAIAFIFAQTMLVFVKLPHLSPDLESRVLTIPLLGEINPLRDIGVKGVAAVVVIFLTALNVRGVKLGATMQKISTTAKMIAILGVVVVAFVWGSEIGSTANWFHASKEGSSLGGLALVGAITMAMSSAFWAYDGWGNVAYIAGEVRDPSRTIPRAIILGTLSFIALYLLVNLAYFYVLPVEAIASAADGNTAAAVTMRVLGGGGAALIAALIMLSTFDTTNSTVLTNARVYYMMGKQGLFYKGAGEIHPKFQTPHIALIAQGVWSLILLISGSFDIITDMYVFVNWVLYVLMAIGVFVLRKRRGNTERVFKVPGYPWVPIIFILFATTYVVLTLANDITDFRLGKTPMVKSVMGLVLVFAGLPFYYFWRNKRTIEQLDARLGPDEPE